MNPTLVLGSGASRSETAEGNSLTRMAVSPNRARSAEMGLDSDIATTPLGRATLQALALSSMLELPSSNLTDFETLA
jgi:hypothetical protein